MAEVMARDRWSTFERTVVSTSSVSVSSGLICASPSAVANRVLALTWQYLCGDNAGNDFDSEKMGHFDKLVQTCLDTGAYCMIDLHNFARFDGGIIGQGGPSDEVFANFWSQMAKFYAKNDKIIFGLMNEPHDLDIDLWADSCQAAVTAIRKAGATSQMILLPGTNFASAETFVSTGSAEALAAIKNPDGSKDGLLLDLHKYLDINNSGTHEECTTDNVEGFGTIATWLRKNKREAIISETGASQSSSVSAQLHRSWARLTNHSVLRSSAPRTNSSTRTPTFSSALLAGGRAASTPITS